MKHTAETTEKINKLVREGHTRAEISEITGLTINQVIYLLYKKMRVANPRQPKKVEPVRMEVNPDIINRIIVLTNWGYSPAEIAEDQQCKVKDVYKIIEEAKYLGKICKKV